MPKGLIRIYGQGDWHFITCSCYRRLPFLGSARHRDIFLRVFEQTRKKYQFVVAGYVVMPEHTHLLIGEPKIANPSRVMQVLKQRVSLQCRAKRRAAKQQLCIFSQQLPRAFWQPRSHDFNVRTKKKYCEKLNYIHMNPVRRGLVNSPELWPWSSFRHYWYGEEGPVKIGE
ncbi:MAG TPA: transposase [Candidatus Acidoferrales bacterium]|nr:transposase [Candidatus Acidoferrales bacterium]